MAGSGLAPIVIPVGGFLGLAIWIFMVFYADSHPVHGRTPPDSGEYDTGLQGTYLTKPELRLPRQRLGQEIQVPGRREPESGKPERPEVDSRRG